MSIISKFIYPRTITIRRPNPTTGVGNLGYQGLQPADETVIAQNIKASIQRIQNIKNLEAKLPGDVPSGTVWAIFFKFQKGALKDRDVIIDDEGIRYQVAAAYWNSLGCKAFCERLQT